MIILEQRLTFLSLWKFLLTAVFSRHCSAQCSRVVSGWSRGAGTPQMAVQWSLVTPTTQLPSRHTGLWHHPRHLDINISACSFHILTILPVLRRVCHYQLYITRDVGQQVSSQAPVRPRAGTIGYLKYSTVPLPFCYVMKYVTYLLSTLHNIWRRPLLL